MKKGSFLQNLGLVIALLCLWIFPHLYLSTEIDVMKNKERNLQSDIKSKNDLIERMVERELKPLESSDRIVPFAEDTLGLVRSLQPFDKIEIDEDRVKQLERIVDEEYE